MEGNRDIGTGTDGLKRKTQKQNTEWIVGQQQRQLCVKWGAPAPVGKSGMRHSLLE